MTDGGDKEDDDHDDGAASTDPWMLQYDRSSVDDGQCCRVSSIMMMTDRDYHYMRLLL